jgi:hypothetical protein
MLGLLIALQYCTVVAGIPVFHIPHGFMVVYRFYDEGVVVQYAQSCWKIYFHLWIGSFVVAAFCALVFLRCLL